MLWSTRVIAKSTLLTQFPTGETAEKKKTIKNPLPVV